MLINSGLSSTLTAKDQKPCGTSKRVGAERSRPIFITRTSRLLFWHECTCCTGTRELVAAIDTSGTIHWSVLCGCLTPTIRLRRALYKSRESLLARYTNGWLGQR